jgi:hypothetical protein
MESRGAMETARRALQYSGQVFRYAIATGRAERDITPDLRGALSKANVQHHSRHYCSGKSWRPYARH